LITNNFHYVASLVYIKRRKLFIYLIYDDEVPTKKALEIDFKDLIYEVRNLI